MTTPAPSNLLPSDADRMADPTGPAFPGRSNMRAPASATPSTLEEAASQYFALQRDRDHLAAVAKGDPAARFRLEQLSRIVTGAAPILGSDVDPSKFGGNAAAARTVRENAAWDSVMHHMSATTDMSEQSLQEFDSALRNGFQLSPENKRAAETIRQTLMADKAWCQRVMDGDVRSKTQMRILSIWRALEVDPALAGKQPRLTLRA